MRKLAVGLTLLTAWGIASSDLEARHRPRVRYCEIAHPAYYYRSFGQRRHGRYAVDHFRRYHRASRYYYSDRRRSRRDHYRPRYYGGGRFYFDSRRGHRHHRRYDRRYRRRPHFSFHFDF